MMIGIRMIARFQLIAGRQVRRRVSSGNEWMWRPAAAAPSPKKKSGRKTVDFPAQNFRHFLVLDFEATCWPTDLTAADLQEIIEFPVVRVDSATFREVGVFHEYVRPRHHPRLSTFCTDLTGITQDMVDEADDFSTVLDRFLAWLGENKQEDLRPDILVTCGEWDLATILPAQCRISGKSVPHCFHRWVNIKKSYHSHYGRFPRSMAEMLSSTGLKHEGRPHSGIDDARNVARLAMKMAAAGHIFSPTSSRL